ncbi:MAG: GNAT family N-acetyltransferase [Pseudomonadota bacterium]
MRSARNDDADDLIALIGGCFAEYQGCILDVDGEIPELRRIASYAERRGGAFWSVERNSVVVACVGAMPAAGGGVELVKLYVRADQRGNGLGRRLIGQVEAFAHSREAGHIELWTDTRFTTAHRAYEACGYVKQAATRVLNDKSNSVEYYYRKTLADAV